MATTEYKLNVTSDTQATISGDEIQISQVINNLVSNAIKYSHGADKVEIYCNRVGDFVKVFVKDNGMSISQIDNSKIFERFFKLRDI
ncbi:sensor histidine kinase [Chryseobacterium sp. KACC 21268]|nr:sensor histidine kinase [Chryseobacterium sp. KACC 21268]